MRLAPAVRRPVALLAATALLSAGGAASGLLVGVAHAVANQQLSVEPQFKGNTDSDANNATLTFKTTGTEFDPNGANATIRLTSVLNGTTWTLSPISGTTVAQPSATNPPHYRSLTSRWDLRQQPPGQYNASVVDSVPGGASTTYSCANCFTITGFKPTVTGIAHDTGLNVPATAHTVSGTDFALGAVVTFEQGGVVDPGVTLTYTPAPASATSPNPTANAIHGALGITSAAHGGLHDIVVTNTNGKRGVCVGCLALPQAGSVYRADQTPANHATLGQGVATHLIVKGSGFTAATSATFSTPRPANTTVAGINVTKVDLVDPQTLDLTVAVDDTSGDTQPDSTVREHSLTVANPNGSFTTVPSAVTVSPRPSVDNDGLTTGPSTSSPGVSSTNFPIDITGTGFQPGATVSFNPPTGITFKSFAPNADASAWTVVVDIAADAPLTARDLVVTNPDLGKDTGNCTGCITPVAAPILASSNPISQSASTSAPVTFDLTLPGNNITLDDPAYRQITFPDDPTFVVGTTVSDDSITGVIDTPTQVTVSVTIPANAAPGPKRVFYRDGNGAKVKCTTPSGGECFSVDNLLVSAVSPNFGTNDGPTTVTVTGTNFNTNPLAKPTVVLQRSGQTDIVATAVTVASSTSLTAVLDLATAAPGTNAWAVRVTNPDGGTGVCRLCFTVIGNTPTLAALNPISPASAPASGQKLITVTGTNFARGASIAFAPTAPSTSNNITTVSSTFLSTTSYQFLISVPAGAAIGPRNVTFSNADGKNVACNACFSVTAPPGVSSVTPASRAPGGAAFTMTVTDGSTGTASAFNGTPTVTFDGTGVTAGTATSVTPKSFSVPVTVAAGATLSKRKVTVTNTDGGVASCVGCFTVVAGPKVATITPPVLARGSSNTQVTVTGTGFGTTPALDLGPGITIGTTTPSADGTSLTALVTVSATATPRGLRDVNVTNADSTNGGKGTKSGIFGIGDKPGIPTLADPTRADRAIILTWTPPDDGGLPITSYTVTVTKTSDHTAVTPTIAYSGTSATVSGLTNGTPYDFVVKATNPIGTGADSAAKPGTPAKAPDAPTGAVATAGDATATISWTAVTGAGEGGDPISGYTVTSNPGGHFTTVGGVVTSAVVTGLTNGTPYTFTVVATNALGDSNPSGDSNQVTPTFALPGAPTGVVADPVPAPNAVSLSWTASTRAAQTPTTSYTVKVTPTAGTINYPANRTLTNATVTGLTNGTSYSFVVVANNTGGPSADSTPVTATPYTLPGAVQNLAGSADNTTADFTWDAPASNGGSPITGYVVTLSGSHPAGVVSGTAPHFTAHFTGLTNGTDYTGTVMATNARGNGPSTPVGPLHPATVPGTPTSPTATAGHGAATVGWAAPVDTGGLPITGYTVTSNPEGHVTTVGGTATSATVVGLTNNQPYTFTIVATNDKGSSQTPATTGPVTPALTAPSAPQTVAGTRGNTAVALTWVAPADNGGTAITSYTVTVAPSAGTVVYPTDRTQPGAAVTGLTNGTSYTFSVVATNAQGTGPAGSVAVTPSTTATAPTNPTAKAGDREALVSFTPTLPANNGGAAITSYTVTAMPGGVTASASTSPILVHSLANGVTYTFTVKANNAAGSSGPSGTSNSVKPMGKAAIVLNSLPGRVVADTVITLAGQVTRTDPAAAYGPVSLLVKYDNGTLATVAKLTPASNGTYRRTVKVVQNGSYYAIYFGDQKNSRASTPVRRVLVSVKITVQRANPTAASSVLTIKGSVAPNKSGRIIELSRVLAGGKLQLLGRARIAGNSTYSFSIKLPKGSYTLQVALGATPGNAANSARFIVNRT
jgi:titin